MRRSIVTVATVLLTCLLGLTLGAIGAAELEAPADSSEMQRYLVIRTFPVGALDGLDAETKAEVNRRNAVHGVRWVRSYATADLTRTYCIYVGPSEEAVRRAAGDNELPVDAVVEIPVDLTP